MKKLMSLEKSVITVDDFLDSDSHLRIKESLEYKDFWTYDPYIAGSMSDQIKDGQLTHSFFSEMYRSPHIEVLFPIIGRIKPMAIWRIKANLQLHGGEAYKSNWHYDFTGDGYPVSDMMTAIYYVNGNNGYTEFTDCKVESVANRMVFFPSNTKHRGVNATNVKARYVINFNYFPMKLDKS